MAISSQGTTFAFVAQSVPFTAHYTSISVEEPTAEVVDMTKIGDPVRTRRMVSTGDVTAPGRVRVDYIRLAGTESPLEISGKSGQLAIANSAAGISVSKKAILESANTEIAVGQFVRGSLNFIIDSST